MNDDDVKILKQKLAAWKWLAIARGRMLAAYRLQTRMPLTALDEAGAARKKLHALGEDKGMTYKIPSAVHAAIIGERESQEAQWGEQNHTADTWMLIFMEEVGEFTQAVLNARYGGKDPKKIREELVQVVAVAVAMLECSDRNEWDKE